MALAPTPAMNLRGRPPRTVVAGPPETRFLHVRVVVVAPIFFSICSWWCLHLHMAKDRGAHDPRPPCTIMPNLPEICLACMFTGPCIVDLMNKMNILGFPCYSYALTCPHVQSAAATESGHASV